MKTLNSEARIILLNLAPYGQCITYKEMADRLGISQPPVISSVAKILEKLIEEDVASKKPILSSLVVQKGTKNIPRLGFFEKLHSLGVININEKSFDEAQWHAQQIDKLKSYYR
ncbi:MAG TPA: hypothetical protein ENJ28_04755 [Gammaproteobacteria bacterium]|nr:hypothetical protein [Gammaproteobacteria bacterium]